jgi:hypothetical protein
VLEEVKGQRVLGGALEVLELGCQLVHNIFIFVPADEFCKAC